MQRTKIKLTLFVLMALPLLFNLLLVAGSVLLVAH